VTPFTTENTKNYILAMVGSFGTTTVAICMQEKVLGMRNIHSTQGSRLLISQIEQLFTELALSMHDITMIMTEQGPGSFTSLRVLIVTANALGLARQIPVVGVNSLQSLAFGVVNKVPTDAYLLSLIDAYGGQAYASIFVGQTLEPLHENLCLPPVALANLLILLPPKPIYVVGMVPEGYQKQLVAACSKQLLHFLPSSFGAIEVKTLVKLGGMQQAQKPVTHFAAITPLYIKANFSSVAS